MELNSKGLYQSLGKEIESCCLVFTSSTKNVTRHLQKSVMQVQSRSFANLNLLFFPVLASQAFH